MGFPNKNSRHTMANGSLQDYKGVYQEMCKMALFLTNIIAGDLVDNPQHIDREELENVLRITHELWKLYPATLSEHDRLLEQLQTCINHFSTSMNTPLTHFIDHDESVNIQRLNTHKKQKY
ncbi:hypothetical protein C9J12_27095 [Photobacterium frigidiphilum]|uniref:Uncharacterized protein n=1 Tax=Photobacterium frigidiphilum TaxID=264736 RepID=A0A2T3J728_9GAMM|nr:hypothetical protein [Photobacterium frigidiphilum]PSU44539.1 hypothetical protein C9J12_27095 [Photobacterium frigidiphilum]